MTTQSVSRFKKAALAVAVASALGTAALFSLPPSAQAVAAKDATAAVTTEVGALGAGVQYGPPSFADLAERVEPAVVSIVVSGTTQVSAQMPDMGRFGDFFKQFRDRMPNGGAERQFTGAGSGFVISADGYVVTNNHVVEKASQIEVVMQDGERYTAEVKGLDPKTDLALLKVDADRALPFVELGDSDSARVGEWVVAVGNPFGLDGTVTVGVVSARGRDINSGPYDDYLQIDAPINRGNSGGPLFNNRGQVIGVNSMIYSPTGGSVGIGFAIPSNMVREIVAELETHGKVSRGWLGVRIQPLTEEIAESLGLEETSGALVAGIEPGSPAESAGVKPGDVIVGLNGEVLEEYRDLPRLVAATDAGNESTLQIKRQGETIELDVEIGNMPQEDVKVALADEADTPKIGVYLAELTPETRQRFRIAEDTQGVLVAGVQQGSPAARAGISVGEVIHMVGQETVQSPEDVIARVQQAAADNRPSVLLMLENKGQQRFVAVKFANA